MLDEYGIREKYNMKDEQFHTAGFDAKCLHYVMEEYRREAAAGAKVIAPASAPLQPPPPPTVESKEKPKPEAKAKRKTPASSRTGKKRKRKQRVI